MPRKTALPRTARMVGAPGERSRDSSRLPPRSLPSVSARRSAPSTRARLPGRRKLQCELQDARDSVVDLDFAPRHFGLRLVSCGEDRMVRVHEVRTAPE